MTGLYNKGAYTKECTVTSDYDWILFSDFPHLDKYYKWPKTGVSNRIKYIVTTQYQTQTLNGHAMV